MDQNYPCGICPLSMDFCRCPKSQEPEIEVPMPARYGSPYCPSCGYKCGCCCFCPCQTPCKNLIEDFCECASSCHGGHEPWDCNNWSTRYRWAKAKAERLGNEQST